MPAKTSASLFDEQARARWRRLFLGSACTLVIVVIAQHMLAIAFDDQLAGLIVAMILAIITFGIVKPIFPT